MLPGKPRGTLVTVIVALALIFGAGALLTRAFSRPSGQPVRVVVPEGSTFRAAADSLARAGVIGRPTLFRAFARFSGGDRSLKPGTYLFRRGTPWRDVLAALTGGEGLVRSVTIPEGYSLAQIAAALSRALEVPADSVLAAARDTTMLRRLDVPMPTLEGYLFPDTYAFPEGTSASRAVAEMVRRFEREWQPEWNERLTALSLSRHQLVTLASIVEREARIAAERPIIAAVYLNRLRIGMPLQADPTVQYARGEHTSRITYQDLEIDSPYNTYKYPGLPPGPISSPGGASLRASLNPAGVDFLYFAAFPDGRHEFRRTFEEHTRVVRESRPVWDSARRAAAEPPR
ncbi:MAG TPA: endolytic transglycosylase MltG [Gemmatimonadaceae bacterium]